MKEQQCKIYQVKIAEQFCALKIYVMGKLSARGNKIEKIPDSFNAILYTLT